MSYLRNVLIGGGLFTISMSRLYYLKNYNTGDKKNASPMKSDHKIGILSAQIQEISKPPTRTAHRVFSQLNIRQIVNPIYADSANLLNKNEQDTFQYSDQNLHKIISYQFPVKDPVFKLVEIDSPSSQRFVFQGPLANLYTDQSRQAMNLGNYTYCRKAIQVKKEQIDSTPTYHKDDYYGVFITNTKDKKTCDRFSTAYLEDTAIAAAEKAPTLALDDPICNRTMVYNFEGESKLFVKMGDLTTMEEAARHKILQRQFVACHTFDLCRTRLHPKQYSLCSAIITGTNQQNLCRELQIRHCRRKST